MTVTIKKHLVIQLKCDIFHRVLWELLEPLTSGEWVNLYVPYEANFLSIMITVIFLLINIWTGFKLWTLNLIILYTTVPYIILLQTDEIGWGLIHIFAVW